MSLQLPTRFEYTNPDLRGAQLYSQTEPEGHNDYGKKRHTVGEIVTFSDDKGKWAYEILDIREGVPLGETAKFWIVKLAPGIPIA